MNLNFVLYAGIVLALAGCAGTAGPNSTLTFDGTGNGAHSETPKCADHGNVRGSGTVHDGSVAISITDGLGAPVFSHTYTADFTLPETAANGAAGTWHVEAQRSSNVALASPPFNGSYVFYVNC